MKTPLLVSAFCIVLLSCGRASFQTAAGTPHYTLRPPKLAPIPYPETLSRYGDVSKGWVDLGPAMGLKVEKAFFKAGAPRNLANYVGLENISFEVRSDGRLRRTGFKPLENRPSDDASVSHLLGEPLLRQRFHRFYFQVVLDKRSGESAAVLLGARSKDELVSLAKRLETDPQSVRAQGGESHAALPPNATASLEFEIVVNGKTARIHWGGQVAAIVGSQRPFRMYRMLGRKALPVEIDAADANALRLPVWPGDRFTW